MNPDLFEAKMRLGEYFHSLRAIDDAYIVIRVDGRSFSKLTEQMDKPFDDRFHRMMVETANVLLQKLSGLYAYTESDEISVLLRRNADLFDREVEKLVSISAAIATSQMTLQMHCALEFDSRIWLGIGDQQVVDYFRWRQADAARCALNGWSYWMLRNEGKSAAAASKELLNKGPSFKNELLFKRGVNFARLPAWQRNGTGIHWISTLKKGFNPKQKKEVTVSRRMTLVCEELPTGKNYDEYLLEQIQKDGLPNP